ncbi:minor capsid protein [Ruminococcus sp.]|uniref:minor capsid protein n=1 Tax=Ruminococcus sp. TaxID=41978 RepID=UPI0025EDCE2F|nr:minor capsid protein [Ruminococcus sp.]
MIIKVKINFNTKKLHAKSAELKQQAVTFVGNELLRKSELYIPIDTGSLRDSGIMKSDTSKTYLMWTTDYAIKQWRYGKSKGLRGRKWALRAWTDHGKLILKNARLIARGKAG